MSLRTFALAPGHICWSSSKPCLMLMEELEKLGFKAFLWGRKEASGAVLNLHGSKRPLAGKQVLLPL